MSDQAEVVWHGRLADDGSPVKKLKAYHSTSAFRQVYFSKIIASMLTGIKIDIAVLHILC
ncbi:MAG: hypothetical protein U0930_14450 [Pirellulales bacterium]